MTKYLKHTKVNGKGNVQNDDKDNDKIDKQMHNMMKIT